MLDKLNKATIGTFEDATGIKIVEIRSGWALCELLVEKRHLSQGNHLHAGMITTLAISAANAGMCGLYADHEFITVGMSVSYIRPVIDGEKIRAEATARSNGRTASVWQVDCYKEDDKLLAALTIDLRILK